MLPSTSNCSASKTFDQLMASNRLSSLTLVVMYAPVTPPKYKSQGFLSSHHIFRSANNTNKQAYRDVCRAEQRGHLEWYLKSILEAVHPDERFRKYHFPHQPHTMLRLYKAYRTLVEWQPLSCCSQRMQLESGIMVGIIGQTIARSQTTQSHPCPLENMLTEFVRYWRAIFCIAGCLGTALYSIFPSTARSSKYLYIVSRYACSSGISTSSSWV